MSDATVEVEREIFEQPLEGEHLQAINALVNEHKGNAALTQQLALDASRLIATSEDRLAQQSGSGFFKRFASKISGKNSANQLQNQVDMLQMQRFAWHYLKQLQQQNLISAQGIAVIRNNLGTMNEYIIETRDFLEEAIDKINRRLEHVENNASFNNWSLNIEANKRRFKSIPSTLLVLHLTYDFMRSHQDVVLTSRDINHLLVTLGKLGVDCDRETRLLDFIGELIEQIEVTGIDRYRAMIGLAFDGHVVDSDFILKNVSGIGFNALYFLCEQYEKIHDLTSDDQLCRSDEDRERIISKFFGAEFAGLSTTYGIRDLIGEVIGGSALAIDIYKEVHGLHVMADEPDDDQHSQETISLTSSLPDIRFHTFLDAAESEEDRRNYLRLLALCIDSSDAQSRLGQEFLARLSDKAGCPALCGEIIGLAGDPERARAYWPVMGTLLSDDDKMYTWLLDAFFLLTLCEKKIENAQVQRILGLLKPAQFRENLPSLLAVVQTNDENLVLDSAAKLAAQTRGWKNIVRYRGLRFDAPCAETQKMLYAASMAAVSLGIDLTAIGIQASKYSVFVGSFDDDGLLGKLSAKVGGTAYSLGRSSSLSSLNEMRKKARGLITEQSGALQSANRMIARVRMPTIEFIDSMGYGDYDLDNAATNEDWYSQFSHLERQISDTLSAFSSACSDASDQLEHFKAGDFDQSVIELRALKRTALLEQERQTKLTKQSVVIEKNGHPHHFNIEWQQVENPPCDPENIRHIKTDGKVWLLIDDDGNLYRSEDRDHWQAVRLEASDDSLSVRNLHVINGMWILVPRYDDGFYYSSDALTWQQSSVPEQLSSYGFSATEEIVYFNGMWLWRFTERTEYSYTDKGLLFDSTKSSTYDRTVVYCADRLDAPWRRWEGTPRLAEGAVVERMLALPGATCLLAFCKYDSLYRLLKKKTDAAAFVSYHIPGKDWRSCTWGGEKGRYGNVVVTRIDDKLMCFCSDQFLTSDKGYEWRLRPQEFSVDGCFHLENVSVFPSVGSSRIYLSVDGETFGDVVLDDGTWRNICANDHGLLAVHSPNSHETILQAGQIICRSTG